jgi:uncharacterized protein (TIGR02145 family)
LICSLVLVTGCKEEDEEDSGPGSQLITLSDIDGNTYKAIQIGDQWWMVNNLRTTHYADGTAIPLVESATDWEKLGSDAWAYCYYNNNLNDEAWNFGALYTWPAAMKGAASSNENPSGIQGVCPDGWHVPSDEEWKELEIFLGMPDSEADSTGPRGIHVGSKLASSPSRWPDGYLKNSAAFGTSGFLAQPGGGRRYNGTFGHLGDNANFWSATEHNNVVAWGRHIYAAYSTSHRYSNVKSDGFSVRCVKDDFSILSRKKDRYPNIRPPN